MIWFAILLIYLPFSLALPYVNPPATHFDPDNDTLFYGDRPDQLGVATTTLIPDIDGGDDSCTGRIEWIRFETKPKIGRVRPDLTMVKLNTFTTGHWTEESLLRMPLYKAYIAQSIIRVEGQSCRLPEVEFKHFTIMARGNPPPIPVAGDLTTKLFNSSGFYDEKFTLKSWDGMPYENCYGFIQYVRVLQTDGQLPEPITVVKLENEPASHFTRIPNHRELLMDAYYYQFETQLLTNSCSDSSDRGFSEFRVYRNRPTSQ